MLKIINFTTILIYLINLKIVCRFLKKKFILDLKYLNLHNTSIIKKINVNNSKFYPLANSYSK